MVGVVIDCRLGNQLFQYAFIKALSEKLNTPFFVNESIEKFIVADYFDVEGYTPVINSLKKLIFKVVSGNLLKSLQAVNVGTYSEHHKLPFNNNKIYSGYFQSELFFENISSSISSFIKVKSKFKQNFDKIYRNTFSQNKIIVIHIRRGDYLNLNDWWQQNFGSNDLTLPKSYYLNCLEQIGNYKQYKIIFVSDDMEFARTEFSYLNTAEFANNDMITDFQLIMNADVCIISNSSFAWWAAYLNQKSNKKVYCPENWLGFKVNREYPDHIIPAEWITVPV